MFRLVFECLECHTHYLPPVEMRYADGSAASAVWCSPCQVVMAARGAVEPPEAAAMATVAAAMALKAYWAARTRPAEASATRRAPSAPARTRRAGSGPGRDRSRLR